MRPESYWHTAILAQLAGQGWMEIDLIWRGMEASGFKSGSRTPEATLGARLSELVERGRVERGAPCVYREVVVGRRIKIAFDVDGVLANFALGVLRVVERVTGRRRTLAEITGWDFADALRLSEPEKEAVYAAISSRGFCAALPTYPNARQTVRRLRALGDICCVTHPWESPWWKPERSSWLALHYGIEEVYFDHVKRTYEADVFVDDKAAHVADWLAAWPGRTAVFWRTPHNLAEPLPAGAHETWSWEALYELARAEALRETSAEASQ